MMRTITTIICVSISSSLLSSPEPDKYSFNLSDPEQVRTLLIEFSESLNAKDFKSEKMFRTEEVVWWYKTIENDAEIIPGDSSLAYIGFLDSLKVAPEIHIDSEKRLVMRTYYQDPTNTSDKHRYAFHIDADGKIDGVLYVPPLTPDYFTDWTEDDFKFFAERLDSNIHMYYDEAVNWSEMNYVAWSCGEVLPLVEELEVIAEERKDEAKPEDSESLNEPMVAEVKESEEVVEIDPSSIPYRRRMNVSN